MKRDARDFILDNLFSMSAYWTCTGTVIASLTSYYAMPLPIANLLTGLTATLLMLQLLGGFWYARTVRKNLFVRCSNALWRLFLPAAFFSVLLPKNIGSAVMTAAYFLTIAVFQIASPSQTDWLVSCVEGNVRKDYYSIREMCFMLSYSAVFCAVSLILYRFNRPETQRAGFFIIAVLISAMMAASLVVLFRLPRPAERKTPAAPLHHMVAAPLHNRDFMRVMAVNVLWSFSCMFVGQLCRRLSDPHSEPRFFSYHAVGDCRQPGAFPDDAFDGTACRAGGLEKCHGCLHGRDGPCGLPVGVHNARQHFVDFSVGFRAWLHPICGGQRRLSANAGGHDPGAGAQHLFFRLLHRERRSVYGRFRGLLRRHSASGKCLWLRDAESAVYFSHRRGRHRCLCSGFAENPRKKA
jgi:hypothetical protein